MHPDEVHEFHLYLGRIYSTVKEAGVPTSTVTSHFNNTVDRRGRSKRMSEWVPVVRSFWRIGPRRRISESAGIIDMVWPGLDKSDGGLFVVAEGSPNASITPFSPFDVRPAYSVGDVVAGCEQLLADHWLPPLSPR